MAGVTTVWSYKSSHKMFMYCSWSDSPNSWGARYQTFTIEVFTKTDVFQPLTQKAPTYMFDRVLNAPLHSFIWIFQQRIFHNIEYSWKWDSKIKLSEIPTLFINGSLEKRNTFTVHARSQLKSQKYTPYWHLCIINYTLV